MAFFIELKGKDLLRALEQINTSIDFISPQLKDFEINARVVVTAVSVPNIQNNPYVLKFRKRIKKLGGTFIFSTRFYSDHI
jgi:hypothetical protein